MGAQVPNTLYGLVLDGGKSSRMGFEKGQIMYHGQPQRDYLMKLLGQVCEAAFLGIRKAQALEARNFPVIEDEDQYQGPLNSILSAHHQYPNVAWLVLACDLPFVDLSALKKLVNERDTNKIATAYAHHNGHVPEPLFAIWEPMGLESVKAYVKRTQKSSPRDFLMESDIKLVHPKDDIILYNANNQTDFEWARQKLSSKGE